MPRRPGRPPRSTPALQPAQVLATAAALIAAEGLGRFSVRGLARTLSVDPMALYHYFPSRSALLAATADHIFAGLDTPTGSQSWQEQLEELAAAYILLARQHRGLIAALVQGDIPLEGPVARFEAALTSALEGLTLSPAARAAVRDLVADYLNGVALAADDSEQWRAGFAILVAGIGVTASGTVPSSSR